MGYNRVVTMEYMFYYARAFDQQVNKWDTSRVTDFSRMFYLADAFNQPLKEWDTSRVVTMSGMFDSARAFDQPVNKWDTSRVTDFSYMFSSADAFNQPLKEWDTSKVTSMNRMFWYAGTFDQRIDSWDVSRTTSMSRMFQGASKFNKRSIPDHWMLIMGDCDGDAEVISNCTIFNSRCACVECDYGLYSSDCSKKCPAPGVAILTDLLSGLAGLWLFLSCTYYYYYQPEESTLRETVQDKDKDLAEEARGRGESSFTVSRRGRKAARKISLRFRALFRIILYHMQVVASVLAGFTWSPKVPQFFIDFMKTIRSVFTLNLPGLMSSPQCAAPTGDDTAQLSPIAKWYMRVVFLFAVSAIFPVWFGCISRRHRNQRLAVKEAGVQVIFIWLFSSNLSACLTILDCTEGTDGELILDPNMPCPLSRSGNGVHALSAFSWL